MIDIAAMSQIAEPDANDFRAFADHLENPDPRLPRASWRVACYYARKLAHAERLLHKLADQLEEYSNA